MLAFFAPEYTQLHPQNEEVFVIASFGGDVKPSAHGSWLILATCAIPAFSLTTFGKNTCRKEKKSAGLCSVMNAVLVIIILLIDVHVYIGMS